MLGPCQSLRRKIRTRRYPRWADDGPPVDATFELFRAYYSPGRSLAWGPDGRPVNAVRGLIDSMLSLLREPDVTHIAAATDYVIESWRNDMFPGYKSSAGMDPDLLAQFRDAERALRSLGITTWPMIEDEADDGLATATARFVSDPRVEQIVICSVDKDLGQCVESERVVLRDRMRRVTYDEDGIRAKFGARRRAFPITWRWWATRPMDTPACRAGQRRALLWCWCPGSTEAIRTHCCNGEAPVRGAVGLAAMLSLLIGPRRRCTRRLSPSTPTPRRWATGQPPAAGACFLCSFLALCDELAVEIVAPASIGGATGELGTMAGVLGAGAGGPHGSGRRRPDAVAPPPPAALVTLTSAQPGLLGEPRRLLLRLDLIGQTAVQHPRSPPRHGSVETVSFKT